MLFCLPSPPPRQHTHILYVFLKPHASVHVIWHDCAITPSSCAQWPRAHLLQHWHNDVVCHTCFFCVTLHNRVMRWVRYTVTCRDVALPSRCFCGLLTASPWPWCACGCFVRVVVSVMMRCDIHVCCCCMCGDLHVWLTLRFQ